MKVWQLERRGSVEGLEDSGRWQLTLELSYPGHTLQTTHQPRAPEPRAKTNTAQKRSQPGSRAADSPVLALPCRLRLVGVEPGDTARGETSDQETVAFNSCGETLRPDAGGSCRRVCAPRTKARASRRRRGLLCCLLMHSPTYGGRWGQLRRFVRKYGLKLL